MMIESWKMRGYRDIPTEPSSTSLPQQWDKPRGPKIKAELVYHIVIARPGNINRNRNPVMATYTDIRKINLKESHILILKNHVSAPISYIVSATSQMVDPGQSQQPLRSALSYHAPLITLIEQPRPEGADVCGQTNFPKPYMMLHLESTGLFDKKHNWQDLNVSIESCVEIEQSTKGQSSSARWFAERKGRITASNFDSIMNRKKEINDIFVRNIFDKKSFKSAGQ
ncbi:uncharacterized protein LOC130053235 [Ostrea edulis]|uniref:uncharacterized protein LOC130053235 n=1 Tax=Ostrea edulis TaxID=37623 RepID=UPI0024AFF5CB|nr:uncharacterized protein LOC130053235 [Ostrea edulis]